MPISVQIKVTVPEIVLDSKLVRDAIHQKMKQKTGPELQREFQKTVTGWENPPRFKPEYHHVIKLATQVFTDSERYVYVNNGTPPHVIPAKGGLLRFQTGYRAATSPRVIGSRKPTRFGPVVTARAVRHPGVEPRLFDEVIAMDYADTFAEDVQDAINMAVKGVSVGRQ